MPKIIDYMVVRAYDLDSLEVAIRKLVDDDWHTQGGVSYNSIETTYLQALVKWAPKAPKEQTRSI
jgi:hypothetical protein